MLDHFEDLFGLELLRSVFQAVGQDRYDHLAWPLRFRRPVEPFADRVDRATDCIQECRGSAGNIAVTIERLHVPNWYSIVSDDVFVIEQYEGQPSLPGEFLLGFQESVYASDGLLFHRIHGAGAIEDKADFT